MTFKQMHYFDNLLSIPHLRLPVSHLFHDLISFSTTAQLLGSCKRSFNIVYIYVNGRQQGNYHRYMEMCCSRSYSQRINIWKVHGLVHAVAWSNESLDLAPVPLTIFQSNSKFNQNEESSSLKHAQPITTKFCTRHDSYTVVKCSKFCRDW